MLICFFKLRETIGMLFVYYLILLTFSISLASGIFLSLKSIKLI